MPETTVDARGLLCPKPLILTKKALDTLAPGARLTVQLDNDVAFANVCRFLTDNGADVSHTAADGVYILTVTKPPATAPAPLPASVPASAPASAPAPATVPASTPTERRAAAPVVCLRSRCLGAGNDELGELLMKGFVSAVAATTPLPATIVLFNSGIFLAVGDAPTVAPLKELEARGVKILVCGTCLNFYQQKSELAVGQVSNMLDIVAVLTQAAHVVSP